MDAHEALREIASSQTATGRPRAPSTTAAVRTVLVSWLRVAERYGHVTRNVAALTAPPKPVTPQTLPLDEAEVRKLLEQLAGHRLESLITVAVSVGLRQSECVGLR